MQIRIRWRECERRCPDVVGSASRLPGTKIDANANARPGIAFRRASDSASHRFDGIRESIGDPSFLFTEETFPTGCGPRLPPAKPLAEMFPKVTETGPKGLVQAHADAIRMT
jgi:hypothetical protein